MNSLESVLRVLENSRKENFLEKVNFQKQDTDILFHQLNSFKILTSSISVTLFSGLVILRPLILL